MKTRMDFFLILCILTVICCKPKTDVNLIKGSTSKSELVQINIPEKIDDFLQWDSLFERVSMIQLETKDECLLNKPSKISINNDKIFLQDYFENLYVFDLNGKFLNKIGSKGKGPGEFIQLVGYDFDNKGNVFITDYHKQLKYTSAGTFLSSIPLNINKANGYDEQEFFCYPEQVFEVKNGSFYVWSGSIGMHSGTSGKTFALHKIDDKLNIQASYFPIHHSVITSFNRFSKFGNYINVEPYFGNDTIFGFIEGELAARYYIDFGQRKLGPVPSDIKQFGEYKYKVDEKYATNIRKISETKNWLYFRFSYNKNSYIAFYSKDLKKVFVSKSSRKALPHKSLIWQIDNSWDEKFIALVEPMYLIEKVESIPEFNERINLTSEDVKLIDQLEGLNDLDNPILFILEMKQYEAK